MIVAVGAWRGAGATMAALALAGELAVRGDGAWLVEADPAGGVLAGRMHLPRQAVGGLERVAFPSAAVATAQVLHEVAHVHGPLHLVTAPADPFRAGACHRPRLPWVHALAELDAPVVVDVGRVRAGSPVWPILTVAAQVLMVTAPEVSAVVSAAEWLEAGGRVGPDDPGLERGVARLLVVDAAGGNTFDRATLRRDLAGGWGGWLPWDAAGADLLQRGALPDDRRLRRSPLRAAVADLADRLKAEVGA